MIIVFQFPHCFVSLVFLRPPKSAILPHHNVTHLPSKIPLPPSLCPPPRNQFLCCERNLNPFVNSAQIAVKSSHTQYGGYSHAQSTASTKYGDAANDNKRQNSTRNPFRERTSTFIGTIFYMPARASRTQKTFYDRTRATCRWCVITSTSCTSSSYCR